VANFTNILCAQNSCAKKAQTENVSRKSFAQNFRAKKTRKNVGEIDTWRALRQGNVIEQYHVFFSSSVH
jgi:hypothetical protein